MAGLLSLPMVPVALRNLVSRPVTRCYPFVPRPEVEGARGRVVLDVATCVFCGLCARRCPANAVAVSREARTISVAHLSCVACGVCVEVCNKDSLRMDGAAHAPWLGSEAGPEGPRPRGLDRQSKPAPAPPVDQAASSPTIPA